MPIILIHVQDGTKQSSRSKIEKLRQQKAALRNAIDSTLEEYDNEVKAVRDNYEPRLSSMVDDYRALQAAIECAECEKYEHCVDRKEFSGFTT